MNASRALAVILALLTGGGPVLAQGFAGLGGDAEGFALPQRGEPLVFPRDHGAHPDYRIEWWYLTANLTGPDGTPYGLQWTLFRSALAPGGADRAQVWMGHAAVTTPEAHHVTERLARGGTGQAGVTADPFAAWIDEWEMAGADMSDLSLTAAGPDWAYDLSLTATGPLVLQGEAGFSVKSPEGQASWYYSQPFFQAAGVLRLPDGDVPVTGRAWLDREWSSQPLSEDQTGWDWFSLSFATGEKLMAFRLRGAEEEHFTAATWISPEGVPEPYPDGAFAAVPLNWHEVAGRDVPVRWEVSLPDRGLTAIVTAMNPDAWMEVSIPYWEGPVTVTGSHDGVGYLEMTGYE